MSNSDHHCSLLSGGFGIPLQIGLALVGLGLLAVKRAWEVPLRPWMVWVRDISKQVLSTGIGHVCNLFLAFQLGRSGDECISYFINFLADNSLGILFNYLLLRWITKLYETRYSDTLLSPGMYHHPNHGILMVWFIQTMEWIIIVVLVKFTLYLLLLRPLAYPLNEAGEHLFSSFDDSPKELLFIVMVIIPTMINALQFWIQDSFLKHDEPAGDEERSPFLENSS